MAEEGDNSQEKTEDPSQRKIEKAAEDGKVLTSKDMFVFTGLFTALLMMYAVPSIIEPCLLYTSPSPRDATLSRMPSSA